MKTEQSNGPERPPLQLAHAPPIPSSDPHVCAGDLVENAARLLRVAYEIMPRGSDQMKVGRLACRARSLGNRIAWAAAGASATPRIG